ncbi:ChbG/HpnK family deacetylase [Candidatus Sororendozoicomonas aggregata]|uniref:ChbG/HpnK family deacetylase n=1 Tax=Candidatus Sororendozoicomonas aggregata TaxID=3073239 RepID=UPI002ED42464
MKRMTLCADDYAMTPGVSRAIVALAEGERIHATSCMVTTEYWQDSWSLLKPHLGSIDRGLHLNFTEGKGLSPAFRQGFPGLSTVLIKSHLRQLNSQDVLQEVRAQINAFITVTGCAPDFIDGHQHVHHLPQIRQALLQAMKEAVPPSCWVRSVTPLVCPNPSLKSRVIEYSGAKALRAALKQAAYPTNSGFAGIYSLSPEEAFRPLMQTWLNDLPDKGLIMCHPGLIDHNEADVDHGKARQIEYDYLIGEHFLTDCDNAGAQRCRLSSLLFDFEQQR